MISDENDCYNCAVCKVKIFDDINIRDSMVGEMRIICKKCSENFRILILSADFDGLIKVYPTPSQIRIKKAKLVKQKQII